jgi:DNA-binding SARP family transcriptional activator
MPAIEEYLENAPKLAQDIVNEWGINMQAGNGSLLSEEFLALNECACRYIAAQDLADNHRKFSGLTEEDTARESATRRTFAEAYKRYWERVSGQADTATPSPRAEK